MNIFTTTMLMKLLQAILISISPIFLKALTALVADLRIAAEETDNPWDDILVDALESFLAGLSSQRLP